MESNDSFYQSRVPWSSGPSLEITREVGVDFDRFIEGLKEDASDSEMAEDLMSEELIYHLRDHFYTHGVHSIVGQD